jgi:hypothetical protein
MPRSLEREASPILPRYPAVWLHRALPARTVPDDAVVHAIRSRPWTVRSVVQTGANSAAPERWPRPQWSRHWISRDWCGRLPRYRAGDRPRHRPPSIRRQAVGPQRLVISGSMRTVRTHRCLGGRNRGAHSRYGGGRGYDPPSPRTTRLPAQRCLRGSAGGIARKYPSLAGRTGLPRSTSGRREVLPRFENRREELANRLISEICSGPMAADIESVASEPHYALNAPAGRAFCLDCVV